MKAKAYSQSKDLQVKNTCNGEKNDYDFIAGHLFQSETCGHYTPFQHDMKGFNFDPQLSFTDRQIKFNMPPNKLKFDSIKIELQ